MCKRVDIWDLAQYVWGMKGEVYALCLGSTAGSAALACALLGWRVVGCVEDDAESAAVVEGRVRDGCLADAWVFCGSVGEFVRGGFAGEFARLGKQLAVVACGFGGDGLEERGADIFDAICAVGPGIVVLEGDEDGGWRELACGRLADLGFDSEGDCVPAAACGSPQTGLRSWVIGVRAADGSAGSDVAA